MEIKLRTTPADENETTIRDEHGALWRYSASKSVYGIFPATTKGLDGKDIHAFYKNGSLFIVNWSDARHYFNSGICSLGNQSRGPRGLTVPRDAGCAETAEKER